MIICRRSRGSKYNLEIEDSKFEIEKNFISILDFQLSTINQCLLLNVVERSIVLQLPAIHRKMLLLPGTVTINEKNPIFKKKSINRSNPIETTYQEKEEKKKEK